MAELAQLIWAVAGLIGVISATVYVFRRPGTSVSIKHKDTEIAIGGAETGKPQLPPPSPSLPASPERADPPISPDQLQLSAPSPSEQTDSATAYELLIDGDYESGMRALETAVQKEESPEQKNALIAFGRHLAAKKGVSRALEDLREMARVSAGVSEVHLWLGIALRHTGAEDEAQRSFSQALSSASSDVDRANAILWSLSDEEKAHDPHGAAMRLLSASRSLLDPRARSRVVAQAAKLFLVEPSPDVASAVALYEFAVELAPTDHGLRFDVAYALSDHGATAASFFHYLDIVSRQPQSAAALNNLGVAADQLSLTSTAVQRYQQSAKLGYTLATANIAWRLIRSGFIQEARSMLEAVVGTPDVHRNVLGAIGGIADAETKEEETLSQLRSRSSWIRSTSTALGEAIAGGIAPDAEIIGQYSEGSAKLELRSATSTSDVSSVVGSLDSWEIRGTVRGRVVEFEWRTPKPQKEDTLSYLINPVKTGFGVLVLREGGRLEGLLYEGTWAADPSRATGYRELRFVRT